MAGRVKLSDHELEILYVALKYVVKDNEAMVHCFKTFAMDLDAVDLLKKLDDYL